MLKKDLGLSAKHLVLFKKEQSLFLKADEAFGGTLSVFYYSRGANIISQTKGRISRFLGSVKVF
ncbi:hypothetical protein [uncultured Phocaeicola sp.]|uniref:hypothetical protein n=1 Tax=uncultured Phocaeicola sp. TaxID=990718 RepID=UPI0025A01BE6|nr:hypothetical protein [uncultured Phocaeicola sp.]